MSDSGGGPGRREVAYRLFASEFENADFSYSESDEERAPNYVVTPTGARVNRLFAVGVLTEVEDVNPEMVRGRVVDPTGAFVSYAGQYQPDELAFLERAETPSFVALSGKARTFEPDDGDRIFSSVRPESIGEVDAETRDRWVVATAERTFERIGLVASGIEADLAGDGLRAALRQEGVDDRLADGIALALEYYDTTPAYLEALKTTAVSAAEVVAGEREEVGRLDAAPDEGFGDASALSTLDLTDAPSPETAAAGGDAATETDAADGPVETETAASESPETGNTGSAATADGEAGPKSPAETAATEPDPEADADDTEPDGSKQTETARAADSDPGGQSSAPDHDLDPAGTETQADDPGEFDADEFELDEEKRREVEEEYGTEFSTAGEVEESGIDAPTAAEETAATESDPAGASESVTGSDPDGSTETTADSESTPTRESNTPAGQASETAAAGTESDTGPAEADDIDLEDAVVETIDALDDGDGAPREALIETVTDEHGATAADVEDAIQDALMSGQCYEPSEDVLKSI